MYFDLQCKQLEHSIYHFLSLSFSVMSSLMAGFRDHACPPPGHHNAHHVLLYQQHDKSRHFGHGCARCIRHLPWGKSVRDEDFYRSAVSKKQSQECSEFNSASIAALWATCMTCLTETKEAPVLTSAFQWQVVIEILIAQMKGWKSSCELLVLPVWLNTHTSLIGTSVVHRCVSSYQSNVTKDLPKGTQDVNIRHCVVVLSQRSWK